MFGAEFVRFSSNGQAALRRHIRVAGEADQVPGKTGGDYVSSGGVRRRLAGTTRCGEGCAHLDRPDGAGGAGLQGDSERDREDADE